VGRHKAPPNALDASLFEHEGPGRARGPLVYLRQSLSVVGPTSSERARLRPALGR